MTGLYGISKEAEKSYNTSSYTESDLCLIVTNANDDFDTVTLQGDTYLTHFFRYYKVEHRWVIYGWDEDCDYYRGIPKEYSGCHRENSYILSSTRHLYFDLEYSSNDNTSTDIEIDNCINPYKMVMEMRTYGRLNCAYKSKEYVSMLWPICA